ncbi:MAG TPA: acylphosphatase [Thermoanaerobaculaceae bacterium]|nr:acylphosphatase [Thermoanaerobaculaceae bacterium]
MVTKKFIVSGRVQGVGFRYFVVREAEALGLAGWVRNLADGRLEVLASGEGATVDVMEGRLWQGPPHARVAAVEVEAAEAPGHPGFRVLSTPW